MTAREIEKKAAERRIDIINMVYRAKAGHIGGSLSSADILCALYYHVLNVDPLIDFCSQPDRDRFILSKGHSVEGYYAVLADKGFFPKSELMSYQSFGSAFIGHPNRKVPGVEFNTGSLGHGLPLGVGVALAAKRGGRAFHTYVLMGDGEQAEGSVYEAAIAASHYKLDNIVAIIDRNRLQISGGTEEVMALEPLGDRWRAFGFYVMEVDGHNMEELLEAFSIARNVRSAPVLLIANTVKGKGVSFIENRREWHHGALSAEQYNRALSELRWRAGEGY